MRRCEALLRRQIRSHNRFLQDVSHDIRSPLNSILFLADALRAEHGGPLNRVQSRQANVLFMASVSLVKLVNDLIDHARLDEDVPIRVASTAFSIQEVVAELRHLVGPLLTYQSVRLMVDLRGEGNRRGDAQLLARVLLNLVTNAAQALPEGGSIRIGVDGTAHDDLRITVRDDGTEADIDALRRGLEDATRGHPPGETRGWTHGLGLTISARLVEAAGGSISVRTPPEGGTLFDLAFPFPPV
jgi:signal transduction histidine kinase